METCKNNTFLISLVQTRLASCPGPVVCGRQGEAGSWGSLRARLAGGGLPGEGRAAAAEPAGGTGRTSRTLLGCL